VKVRTPAAQLAAVRRHISDVLLTGEKQMNQYAFFYFMKDDSQRIRDTAPRHADYWKTLAPPDYMGGPFADRSGGLITFSAPDEAEAERVVSEDPFVIADVLTQSWLKPWDVS
jgi:uncharacterized protein YciI